MSYTGVTVEIKNGLAMIKLNNPGRANALSKFLVADLASALAKLKKSDGLHSVIFTGGESKAFCSGADLKERLEMDGTEIIEFVSLLRRVLADIEELPMPTIAAIKGLALGGGCELALACDIRIIEENALIGLPEVSWGIIPGAGGTQRLTELIGAGKAKKMIFTAAKLTGSEAYEIGLAEYIVSRGQSEEKALEIAKEISCNSRNSIELAKKAINFFNKDRLVKGLEEEWSCYKETINHSDRLEGLASFNEKRKPKYF
ncbi:enoyl-CoA hydratase-related protein [Metabacillus fastidiosus]|uniref:enoyl-CoA hydratase-related protein n=1 Tax=Metabacillus fastidiosus TaxID=1458 RepID=UPI003D2C2B91